MIKYIGSKRALLTETGTALRGPCAGRASVATAGREVAPHADAGAGLRRPIGFGGRSAALLLAFEVRAAPLRRVAGGGPGRDPPPRGPPPAWGPRRPGAPRRFGPGLARPPGGPRDRGRRRRRRWAGRQQGRPPGQS